ncbi:hypothetical protein EVAR_75473_1 [Eumeta japonica]|uniref:Ig-like domain-containing protein n=1 Tax=Eumeta variegata TaxID=151549 RepID=A0A4C1TN07_EUMVA|nr:hypothetical protein EVAR_75473_1 [Eumeta japonica]
MMILRKLHLICVDCVNIKAEEFALSWVPFTAQAITQCSYAPLAAAPAFSVHAYPGHANAMYSAGIKVCRFVLHCCARGRPIIVEWERDARHSALSRSVTHRYVTERYTFFISDSQPQPNLRRCHVKID